MGTFFAEVQLASPALPDRRETVKLLVDSGSMYTWVSAKLLRELGVQPTERRRLLTIEGRVTEREAAEVLITVEGRTLHTVCLFGNPGDLEVLGAYTLEGFGFGIDPVQRRLIPAILYGASAAPFSAPVTT
jgi:predicted aspartyl protease